MRVGTFCFIPDFGENVFRLSPLSIAFVMKYITSVASFFRAFIMKWLLDILKSFSGSIDHVESCRFHPKCVCVLFYMYTLTCILNQPCISAVKSAWSWGMTISTCRQTMLSPTAPYPEVYEHHKLGVYGLLNLKKDTKLGHIEVGVDLRGVKKRNRNEYDQNTLYGTFSENIF